MIDVVCFVGLAALVVLACVGFGNLLEADVKRREATKLAPPVEKPRVCRTHVRRLQSRTGLDISDATNPPSWRRRAS